MRISMQDVPVKIDVPGATARQLPDFGVASGTIGAEYFSMAAGTDLAPLLEGLDGDMCHGPHWGSCSQETLSSATATAQPSSASKEISFTGQLATAFG